jgi:hypothetical protein
MAGFTGSKLGIAGPFTHRDASDFNYWRGINPRTFKVTGHEWTSRDFMRTVYTDLPTTKFIYRNIPQSHEYDDVRQDPVGTGKRHARDWHTLVHTGRNNDGSWLEPLKTIPGFDITKNYFVGLNEPPIWWMGYQTVGQYTVAFLEELASAGVRGVALTLPVGWPDGNGPDTTPDWRPFEAIAMPDGRVVSLPAVIRAGNHVLGAHEYWADAGPEELFGWWVGRILQCPWNVPIYIGEVGIDRVVKYGGEHKGWNTVHTSGEAYFAELERVDRIYCGDERIIGADIFTYDYEDNEWASFGVQGIRHLWLDYANRVRNRHVEYVAYPRCPVGIQCRPREGGSTPPPPPSDYRNRLFAAGQANQKIQFNPNAGIQRKMTEHGYVPNSPEFPFEGKVAQRGERLDNGAVRMYTWSATEGVRWLD